MAARDQAVAPRRRREFLRRLSEWDRAKPGYEPASLLRADVEGEFPPYARAGPEGARNHQPRLCDSEGSRESRRAARQSARGDAAPDEPQRALKDRDYSLACAVFLAPTAFLASPEQLNRRWAA